MRISDPNKLIGKVMEIKEGADITEVIVDIGDFAVTASLTSSAYQDLRLKKGDEVFTMFNSTDVTLIKDS